MSINQLLGKVFKRIYHASTWLIPRNTQYRVAGLYPALHHRSAGISDEGIKYLQIHPSYTSGLDTSNPFYELCTKGLRPQPVSQVPASFILEVPNGRLYQDIMGTGFSVLTQDNKLIGEVSYQYKSSNVGTELHQLSILKQKLFTKPVAYKGLVFSMLSGSVASTNFFHWLYDALPRIYLLKESGLFDKINYFLVPALKHPYHKETLSLLGIDLNKVVECENLTHIVAEKLIVSSHIRHKGLIPEWVCAYHRKAFTKKITADNTTYPPFIYIRRGDSKIRQVVNEDELIQMLERYGFRTYLLSKLPFKEQVKLLSSAKVIVAAHGAGLSNLSFCSKGTALIELFAADYIKPTYQIISKHAGINYQYIICPATGKTSSRNIKQALISDIRVNISQVEESLSRIDGMRKRCLPVSDTFIPEPMYAYAQLGRKASFT